MKWTKVLDNESTHNKVHLISQIQFWFSVFTCDINIRLQGKSVKEKTK